MADDLVKRLRDLGDHASFEPHMYHTAADRIEALEREREHLEATAIQDATVAQSQRARAEAAEAKAREAALDALAAYGQANDAYEAQLKAEAAPATARADATRAAYARVRNAWIPGERMTLADIRALIEGGRT